MDFDDPVSIYSVTNPNEAEILRNALESEGIRCRLDGAGQAGLTGIMEINVLVRAVDADRARAIIESQTT